jgi:phosphatidylserine/phosphatidylglycerophosphate/cardiolipin synthase-like enzyme
MENEKMNPSPTAHEKLDAVIDYVKTKCPENMAHKFYGVSYPEYESVEKNVFDTPHDYWNTTNPLPQYHSERFHKKIADMLSNSRDQIDIVTMALPSGNLNRAIQWGVLKALDHAPSLRMRVLCGSYFWHTVDTEGYIREFVKQLREWGVNNANLRKLELYVASQDVGRGSGWNHGKVMVSGHEEIIWGGHNMWGADYMESNPVFDLSMALKGDLALDGTYYANELWEYVKKNNGSINSKTFCNSFTISERGELIINNNTPQGESGRVRNPPVDKGVKALYLAQPGLGLIDHEGSLNPIFVGTNYAISIAKRTMNVIQQDVGSMKILNGSETGRIYTIRGGFKCLQFIDRYGSETCHGFYYDVLDSLAHALKSKLRPTLNLVLSNPSGKAPNGGEYGHGLSWRSIYRALGFMLHKVYKLDREKTIDILTNSVFIRHFAFQGHQQWPDGKKYSIGLHTKYWEIDGEISAIGSFNLYPSIAKTSYQFSTSYLNEFCVVLSGEKIVNDLQTQYFKKVWDSSVYYRFDPALLNDLPEFHGLDVIDEEMSRLAVQDIGEE